jgi:hypothetical protein
MASCLIGREGKREGSFVSGGKLRENSGRRHLCDTFYENVTQKRLLSWVLEVLGKF